MGIPLKDSLRLGASGAANTPRAALILMASLSFAISGCASAPASDPAICAATERARTQLAAALVDDGGPSSRRAGAVLIAGIDAGCE